MANKASSIDRVIQVANDEAYEFKHEYLGTEHLLLAMTKTGGLETDALRASGASYDSFRKIISNNVGMGRATNPPKKQTPRSMAVMQQAKGIAQTYGQLPANAVHLLLAILEDGESFSNIMFMLSGVDKRAVKKNILELSKTDNPNNPGFRPGGESALSKYTRDLNNLAEDGKIDPVIGRDKEIERIIQVLMRRKKNNPVLIGEPGVGKTAIVEGLAERIVRNDVPDVMLGKRIYSLDLASLIAGTKFRGDFEERIKMVIEELQGQDDIILFIDEFHTIIGAGNAEGAMDAANILKPVLARGELQIIGATTTSEYRKNIEKDTALERRLQPITIAATSISDSKQILRGLRSAYEKHHNVGISDEAIDAAVELSDRYIQDRYLPDKAIDLIDEACARMRVLYPTSSTEIRGMEKKLDQLTEEKEEAARDQQFERAAQLRDEVQNLSEELEKKKQDFEDQNAKRKREIGFDEIAGIVSEWSKIPVTKMTEEEKTKYKYLDVRLKERVIGQDEAVDALSQAIKRARVGLKDPKKPIASFIFVGPTGVGKTYLAKSLAEELFSSEESMIRLDMSEYMEKHTVSKLIGSPPGYVGYDEGGQLTEAVRKHPYSVILLDEIEKAHPDVFNILLQIMDDGRLTDAQGRTVSFKNTVLIMTSNVGASLLQTKSTLGFTQEKDQEKTDYENMKDIVNQSLKDTFRPEFLNRVDETIVFRQLDENSVNKITALKMEELKKQLQELSVNIEYGQDLIDYIADKGYDNKFGARPLDRVINKDLNNQLAEAILAEEVNTNDTVIIGVDGQGKLKFSKKERVEESADVLE